MPQAPELTFRAVVAGIAIGILNASINTYMGLKTGWWDAGAILASILGFTFFSTGWFRRSAPYSVFENNITQTTAASMGAMPSAIGLLGAIPGLMLAGQNFSLPQLALWGVGLGLFGAVLGFYLRDRLLIAEQLAFPTGAAAAEVISALHRRSREAIQRTRALLGSAVTTMAVVWFRDGRPTLVPQASAFWGSIQGIPCSSLTLGIAWSPLMLGVGLMVGPHTGLSLLLGAFCAWGMIAPWLVKHGIANAEYSSLAGWLAWPGVGLMVGTAGVAFAKQGATVIRAFRDLPLRSQSSRKPKGLLILGIAAVLVTVLGGLWLFDLNPVYTLLALLLSLILCTVCARAAGETDIAPFGQIGQLAQALFGIVGWGRQPVSFNVAAGSIPAGSAAQTVSTLWSFRAGQRLGAAPRSQWIAQLLGIFLGTAACLPAYFLLTNTYGLGTERLPVPFGIQWKAMGEVVSRGASALPSHAVTAVGLAIGAGVVLALASSVRASSRFAPSPTALGIAFIAPANYSVTFCIGGLLVGLAHYLKAGEAEQLAPSAGAGAIAGESLVGLIAVLLTASGLIR
jgi:uncharacterized oligopeptide transporter (OPT) family protein